MARPVSPEEVAAYRRDGWVRLEGLLDDAELATVRRCIHEAGQLPEFQPRADVLGAQAYRTGGEYRKMLQHMVNLHRRFPELEKFARDPVLGGAVRDLMGSPHVRFFLDQTFKKPPRQEGGYPTPWHQDYAHHPFDRRGCLALWIALEDVTVEMGPLTFLSGSHRLGPIGRADVVLPAPGRPSDPGVETLLRPDDTSFLSGEVTVALRAGDATAHDSLTLHRGGANTSERVREAWSLIYIPSDVRYTGAPYFNTDGIGLTVHEELDHERFPLVA